MAWELTSLIVGGVAGTLLRWGVGTAAPRLFGAWLPWGTLIVNLSGCLLIGAFDALIRARGFGGPTARIMLITGFCGAYTTFSSLILEFDGLLRAAPGRAMLYAGASAAVGLLMFRLGGRLAAG